MVLMKKVVEEVSGWLRVYDDGSVDRTWTGPPEVKFLAEPVPASEEFSVGGVATRDVVLDAKLGLSVRIYLPDVEDEAEPPPNIHKLPVLLHFHGGGFCISRADWFMYYAFYTRLVRSARAVCVSVFLRRAPEHRLPAACDDAHAALHWLRAAPDPWLEARADLSRVFLIGDSSGGNVVHHVAARAGSEDLSPLRIAGAIPIHGGFVRSARSESERRTENESPFLTLSMLDKFLALALPEGSSKDHPITSPMGPQAPPLEDQDLPPFLVPIAERDLVYDTEVEYVEAMRKAGKTVEVVYSPGLGHCFYLNKIAVDSDPHTASQTEFLIAAISEFIRKH